MSGWLMIFGSHGSEVVCNQAKQPSIPPSDPLLTLLSWNILLSQSKYIYSKPQKSIAWFCCFLFSLMMQITCWRYHWNHRNAFENPNNLNYYVKQSWNQGWRNSWKYVLWLYQKEVLERIHLLIPISPWRRKLFWRVNPIQNFVSKYSLVITHLFFSLLNST